MAKKAVKKAAAKRNAAAKTSTRSTAKRELIHTEGDKRYVKRRADGRFKESDDVGRSLSVDRRRAAKKAADPGYGDQGDVPPKRSPRDVVRRTTRRAAKKR